jgi:DNA-binding MarR family transcriptional regulator
MEAERFNQFVQLIESVHKSVNKIKLSIAPTLGVKSVHVFWLYELLSHPEGLTAATLANKSKIDRSLISREVEELRARGYIEVAAGGGEKRKNYNSRIRLTEQGRELAQTITGYAMAAQLAADSGVSEEELQAFYATLKKLSNNLSQLAEQPKALKAETV